MTGEYGDGQQFNLLLAEWTSAGTFTNRFNLVVLLLRRGRTSDNQQFSNLLDKWGVNLI